MNLFGINLLTLRTKKIKKRKLKFGGNQITTKMKINGLEKKKIREDLDQGPNSLDLPSFLVQLASHSVWPWFLRFFFRKPNFLRISHFLESKTLHTSSINTFSTICSKTHRVSLKLKKLLGLPSKLKSLPFSLEFVLIRDSLDVLVLSYQLLAYKSL